MKLSRRSLFGVFAGLAAMPFVPEARRIVRYGFKGTLRPYFTDAQAATLENFGPSEIAREALFQIKNNMVMGNVVHREYMEKFGRPDASRD